MNENPLMIMMVNMTIVFAILTLLWAIISLTGIIANKINDNNE